MARRRSREPQSLETAPHHVAAQQDGAEISHELGAEADPENGGLVVDEKAARQAGAVDTESVTENRRLKRMVHGKRTGARDIHINVDDILVKYDTILRLYPADTMYITVKRISGGASVTQLIQSYPRTGRELYEALKVVHGRHEEATYAVNFFDATNKEYRGKGQITMPDTRDPAAQGHPSMSFPYGAYPPGPPPPPGFAQPLYGAAPGAPSAPQTPDLGALLTGFRQVMEMMQTYQQGGPFPAAAPGFAGSPQAQGAPGGAPPVPGDFSAQIHQLRQMLDFLQSSSGPGAAARGAPPGSMNPQMAAAMMGMGMPPVQPPPGTIWVPGFGFVSLDALMRAVGPGGPGGAGGYRGPYRPAYAGGAGVGGGEGELPHRSPYAPPPAPSPERSAAEQFRDSISLIRTAASAARDFGELFPTPGSADGTAADDDSPVRIIDTGPAKIVVNRRDGSLRPWETGWANVDQILKWAGEQLEHARARDAERNAQRTALPQGYVEVGPGYQPPPGFFAVPVHPHPPAAAARRSLHAPPPQSPLSAPPAQMPPPLESPAAQAAPPPARPAAAPTPPPARRTWAPPVVRVEK